MRIIVTGGAGFIGSAAVRRALADGHAVLNLDALTYAGRLEAVADVMAHPAYAFRRLDITDAPAVADALETFAPDALLHLAAETHVDRSIDDAGPFVRTNVLGTQVLLDGARRWWQRQGHDARERFRFLAVSTDEVYGDIADGASVEGWPYRPSSPYAASKAAADHLALAAHRTHGLPVIVTHCANNHGPWQHPEKLIPTVVRHALAERPIPLYGDGGQARDWLHVDDHVAGLLLALERGRPGEAYGFGHSGPLTNLDLARRLCGVLDARRPTGAPRERLIRFVADRPGHDRRYALDPAKATRELGWAPRHDLESGLAATVDWLLTNPGWLERPAAELGRLGLGGPSGVEAVP